MRDERSAADDSGRDERAVRLSVPEMDCPSCAGKVEKSLGRVDGLGEVDTRPTTGVVSVSYDIGRVTEDDVVTAIESAGYEVAGGSDTGDDRDVDIAPPADVWTSPRARKTWVGAAFLTVGLLLEFVVTGANRALGTGY